MYIESLNVKKIISQIVILGKILFVIHFLLPTAFVDILLAAGNCPSVSSFTLSVVSIAQDILSPASGELCLPALFLFYTSHSLPVVSALLWKL